MKPTKSVEKSTASEQDNTAKQKLADAKVSDNPNTLHSSKRKIETNDEGVWSNSNYATMRAFGDNCH